jgi:hypothetical protein
MLDFYFFYKNIGRYILILKKSIDIYNNINILDLAQLIIYFNINNIKDINNIAILNYIYFLKYYFYAIPFFSNYKYKFHLNIDYYSFYIQFNFIKKYIYYPLFFFANDIFYMINKSYIKINKNINFIEYSIIDMNFFIEKKNSVGFFNLKVPINFKFFIKNFTYLNSKNLIILFKLKN